MKTTLFNSILLLAVLIAAPAFAADHEMLAEYRDTASKLTINHKAQVDVDRKIFAARAEIRRLTKARPGSKAAAKLATTRQSLEEMTATRRQLVDDETTLRVRLATLEDQCPGCARDSAVTKAAPTTANGPRVPASTEKSAVDGGETDDNSSPE